LQFTLNDDNIKLTLLVYPFSEDYVELIERTLNLKVKVAADNFLRVLILIFYDS